MIQCTVDDGDTTSNTDLTPINAEQLAKPSRNIIPEKLLQNLQSSGHKVLILSHMVCVLEFIEDLLRVKKSKYERLDGSKSTSYHNSAVYWFFQMSYQIIFMILRTRVGGLGLDLPAADTNFIFDNYWNPKLRTTLSPIFAQWP